MSEGGEGGEGIKERPSKPVDPIICQRSSIDDIARNQRSNNTQEVKERNAGRERSEIRMSYHIAISDWIPTQGWVSDEDDILCCRCSQRNLAC